MARSGRGSKETAKTVARGEIQVAHLMLNVNTGRRYLVNLIAYLQEGLSEFSEGSKTINRGKG